MGLGQAAMEQMSGRSDRAVITNTFSGYYIPTAADMPKVLIMDIVGCEVEDGPYGAGGMPEGGLLQLRRQSTMRWTYRSHRWP